MNVDFKGKLRETTNFITTVCLLNAKKFYSSRIYDLVDPFELPIYNLTSWYLFKWLMGDRSNENEELIIKKRYNLVENFVSVLVAISNISETTGSNVLYYIDSRFHLTDFVAHFGPAYSDPVDFELLPSIELIRKCHLNLNNFDKRLEMDGLEVKFMKYSYGDWIRQMNPTPVLNYIEFDQATLRHTSISFGKMFGYFVFRFYSIIGIVQGTVIQLSA